MLKKKRWNVILQDEKTFHGLQPVMYLLNYFLILFLLQYKSFINVLFA